MVFVDVNENVTTLIFRMKCLIEHSCLHENEFCITSFHKEHILDELTHIMHKMRKARIHIALLPCEASVAKMLDVNFDAIMDAADNMHEELLSHEMHSNAHKDTIHNHATKLRECYHHMLDEMKDYIKEDWFEHLRIK